MIKISNIILSFVSLLSLAACAGSQDELALAEASGSPFTKALTTEYRQYAADDYFARKGLASASGVVVMPAVPPAGYAGMEKGYGELVILLETGGRTLHPALAAKAQGAFDCWVKNAAPDCHADFVSALQNLYGSLSQTLAKMADDILPEPVRSPPVQGRLSINDAMLLVFFDWDKYDITPDANDVLDAISADITTRGDIKNVVVVGHADTSGPEQYNRTLSIKRAKAVQQGLADRGVNKDMILIEGRGEKDPMIKTPDNVREPSNRRAAITLE